MTPDILEYLLRATVIWAVLLAYYGLALRRTGFAFQRFYLLGSWLFGLMVPLLPSLAGAAELPVLDLPRISLTKVVGTETAVITPANNWRWQDVLPYLYLTGLLFFGARTLVQCFQLRQWMQAGDRGKYQGFTTVTHPGIPSPFAAWGRIFLPQGMDDAELTRIALIHETAHLRSRHHYDNFLLTIGSLLLWFHPLSWGYRKLLATVHEYQADAAVLQRVPARIYGRQLLQAAMGPTAFAGLFSSPLKQRITMLSKPNRQSLRLTSLLFILPFLLLLTFACSDLTENEVLSETTEYVDQTGELPQITSTEYDDAKRALLESIYREIRYPRTARNSGTTANFDALIYVAANGTLDGVRITETKQTGNFAEEIVISGYAESTISGPTVPELLHQEVDRTIAAIAPFVPLEENGKRQAAVYQLSFKFKLE